MSVVRYPKKMKYLYKERREHKISKPPRLFLVTPPIFLIESNHPFELLITAENWIRTSMADSRCSLVLSPVELVQAATNRFCNQRRTPFGSSCHALPKTKYDKRFRRTRWTRLRLCPVG